MKPLLTILLFTLSLTTYAQKEKTLSLTVTHINRTDKGGEIWAKGKPFLYVAKCPYIPDTLKAGSKIIADPVPDTCKCECVFKKFVRKDKKRKFS